MFYSETILSRRGPLGKVWLAAHMERKLSKSQTLQTDIEQSVDAIKGQEIEVMALRLSGQLLLGVVRIYSRKAKYLLDDCNEALLKIKMAFRPGIVDMTEEQLVVNKTAITLQVGSLDLDLLLPDINWNMNFEDRPLHPQGHHQAHIDDITLRTADDYQQYNLNDPFDVGPSDGIGSQDFNDVDLGIGWDDEPQAGSKQDLDNVNDQMSVDGSVGIGRDAVLRRDSVGSHLAGKYDADIDMDQFSTRTQGVEAGDHPFGASVDMDFPELDGLDLGDFGIGFDAPQTVEEEREQTPGQTRTSSRASSALNELPVTPFSPVVDGNPPAEDNFVAKRKQKEKKQIIDEITELVDGPGVKVARGRNGGLGAPVVQDVSGIVTEQLFLPRSSIILRLLEIRDDPLAHFLPTSVTASGSYFCAAPPGLAPELSDLFKRPLHNTLGQKRRGASLDKMAYHKRTRLDGYLLQDDEEIEQARRAASLAPSAGIGSAIVGRSSMGPDSGLDFGFGEQSAAMDDFRLDVPEFEAGDVNLEHSAQYGARTDQSRLSTPGPLDEDESYADATCPIASFDPRPSGSGQSQAEQERENSKHDGKGYSKNTVKALGLLRKELQPCDAEVEEKVVSFKKMADKASRRAAATFFFELLVLGTRDCIQLEQTGPFENIQVQSKPNLWKQQSHTFVSASFRLSMTPSRYSSVSRSTMSPTGL